MDEGDDGTRLAGEALARHVRVAAERAGLAAVGFAPAVPMRSTRVVLEERKAAGLHGGMQFTYRNPARSTDPGRALAGAVSLVVCAWPYGPATGPRKDSAAPAGASGRASATSPAGAPASGAAPGGRPRGRVARYAARDFYGELRAALGEVASVIGGHGWRTRALCDDNALVDRAAAERAGLGWFGKNANLLLPGRGSWFVLGSVLTDAPLPATPKVQPGCGACRRCLGSCPTGALVAPGVLDARRCLAWLLQAPGPFPREHRAALGDRVYGCDECQESCPPNRAQDRRAEEPEEATVDLLELLDLGDDQLLARFGRWYIAARDPRFVRRNALVALGNVMHARKAAGTEGPPEVGAEVAATLVRYLASADELLRAHAVWAAYRAGRGDLVDAANLTEAAGPGLVGEELAHGPEVAAGA